MIAQRTPAANIRSWCLTRALALEGQIDTSRLYRHRFSKAQVIGSQPDHCVPILRVLVDPELAHTINLRLAWDFGAGVAVGLHLRNSIAYVNDGVGADAVVTCLPMVWADLLTNRAALSQVLADGSLTITGDVGAAIVALGVFEVDGLRS